MLWRQREGEGVKKREREKWLKFESKKRLKNPRCSVELTLESSSAIYLGSFLL